MSERVSVGLPPSWVETQLSEISTLVRGVSYKKEDAEQTAAKGFVPVLRATNITGSALTFENLVHVPVRYVSETQRLKIGDIVIASSSGSKEIVGKSGQVSSNPLNASFGAFCTAVRPEVEVNARYLGLYFQSPVYREAISEISAGSNINNIKSSELLIHLVPVAAKEEQTRVVEKLEELLSDLDAGVAELKAAQRKLVQYRQSLLKAAVEGALTAEWRNASAQRSEPQETGADLLQRILTERRGSWERRQLAKFAEQGKTPPKDWKAKYSAPVAPDIADVPALPEGWVWASVDQCALDENSITDGPFGSNLKSSHYTESGPRVLRLQNIGDGYFVDAKAHISESHYAELTKHAVAEGDVVIAMLGEVLPRACIVPTGVAPAIVKADCARVRLNPDLLLPALLNAALNSEPTRKRVVRLVKGIGRPRVNLGNLRRIAIPLPPLIEQQVICDALAVAFEASETQSEALQYGLRQSAAQRKNILKAAFAGQLVPQDPSDEPASALLERIRAERAAAGSKRTGKSGRMPKEQA